MLNITPISTKGMSHEEWLNYRQKTIGGSDAAAIAGLSEYSSPYSVWAQKMGKLPPVPDNEAMRQGRDLEEYVARRWTEATGKKVRRRNAILYNPQYPFAHANIDFWVVGENAGLECKTTSILNLKRFKNGDFPPNYYCQCMHYMAVTGAERWYLAVLVLNQGFYEYTIERDEDEIAELMRLETEFAELMEKGTPPSVDGSKATTETLLTLYPEGIAGTSVDLFGRDEIMREYIECQNGIKSLEKRLEAIKQTLMQDLGESEAGQSDQFRISWKQQTRNSFDVKAFTTDNPEIDLSDYYKASTYRTFRLAEIK